MANPLLPVAGLLLFIAAVAGYVWLQRLFATPVERLGKVVYAGDDSAYRMLRDQTLGLRGRPDFIVKRGPHAGIWWSAYSPVEYKSAQQPAAPRPRDVAQLAAYGLLVAQEFGSYPRHGYLIYGDGKPMKVRLGHGAEKQIRLIVKTMRGPRRYPAKLPLDQRCNGCFVRALCPLQATPR